MQETTKSTKGTSKLHPLRFVQLLLDGVSGGLRRSSSRRRCGSGRSSRRCARRFGRRSRRARRLRRSGVDAAADFSGYIGDVLKVDNAVRLLRDIEDHRKIILGRIRLQYVLRLFSNWPEQLLLKLAQILLRVIVHALQFGIQFIDLP